MNGYTLEQGKLVHGRSEFILSDASQAGSLKNLLIILLIFE